MTVEIKDGFAKFNATGLVVGEYTVNVTYLGDNLYNASSNITKFNITKANMTANVTAQNITVKDNVQIVIDNVTRDFTGNVTIEIIGLDDYDGIVKAVTEMGKLKAGNYTATVTFHGDNNYEDNEIKVNFTVSRVDPEITVRINDTTYPGYCCRDC